MEKLYKYPVLVAGIIGVVTVFFATQLPRLQLDNNNMRFLPDGNEARIISEYIDNEFGGQVMILVGLERPHGTIFDSGFLAKLKDFADTVEYIDFVKDVNSIMSTKYITGDSDTIIVTDLVPNDFLGELEEIEELKRRIASWDLFQGSIVSNDHHATQVMITLDVATSEQTSREVTAVLFEIRGLARETFAEIASVYVTGVPVISATINEAIINDNIILIPLAFVVMLAVLFFSLRRFTFVALPTLTVIAVIIWTAGLMGLLGIKLSILTTLLPVILLAIGNSYAIHVVIHYMEDREDCHAILSIATHRALVFEVMHKMIKPVFLTAITTFAGFISFCFTPIVPMREFGAFAGVGVIVSFIVTVTLIPALLLIRGPKPIKSASPKRTTVENRFNNIIGNFFIAIARNKLSILIITMSVVAFSVYGLSRIIVDNVLIEFFQKETDISRSDRFINERFGGSKELAVVVTATSTEELLFPDVLSAVDYLSEHLTRHVPEVGKVIGFTDIIKRINQIFNIDQDTVGLSYYEIPTNPMRYGKETPEELQQLISNYLVLLAGDDSNVYSNDPLEPTAIKTSIQLRTIGNQDTLAVIDRINKLVAVNFPANVQVMIGGAATQEAAITELIVTSQIISIGISVLIVFLIIALSYKSFTAGFIAAVPLAIAILCNFAVMGFLGIKLNIGTALIASLALSIGIDYTIHFIEAYKREYAESGSDFLRRTFIGCGKAIIVDSVSVGAGFAVLAFSQFKIVAQMGSLVAFSMMITALVSLTVIPALLTTIKPAFIYRLRVRQ